MDTEQSRICITNIEISNAWPRIRKEKGKRKWKSSRHFMYKDTPYEVQYNVIFSIQCPENTTPFFFLFRYLFWCFKQSSIATLFECDRSWNQLNDTARLFACCWWHLQAWFQQSPRFPESKLKKKEIKSDNQNNV